MIVSVSRGHAQASLSDVELENIDITLAAAMVPVLRQFAERVRNAEVPNVPQGWDKDSWVEKLEEMADAFNAFYYAANDDCEYDRMIEAIADFGKYFPEMFVWG